MEEVATVEWVHRGAPFIWIPAFAGMTTLLFLQYCGEFLGFCLFWYKIGLIDATQLLSGPISGINEVGLLVIFLYKRLFRRRFELVAVGSTKIFFGKNFGEISLLAARDGE